MSLHGIAAFAPEGWAMRSPLARITDDQEAAVVELAQSMGLTAIEQEEMREGLRGLSRSPSLGPPLAGFFPGSSSLIDRIFYFFLVAEVAAVAPLMVYTVLKALSL